MMERQDLVRSDTRRFAWERQGLALRLDATGHQRTNAVRRTERRTLLK